MNVFVLRGGKLLFGKRKNCYRAGEWGLPGGHLELGEQFVAGAARELFEETGLSAKSYSFLNIVNQPTGNSQHYIQVAFLAEGVEGEVENKEPHYCEEWRWFPLGALPEEIFGPHRDQIELFLEKKPFLDA